MRLCRYSVLLHRKRLLACSLMASITLLIYMSATTSSRSPREKRMRNLADPKGGNNLLVDEDDVAFKIKSSNHQAEYIDKKGMHVVVGKYVGESIGKITPNFTNSELNENGYDPVKGAGENGQPHFLEGNDERRGKRLWHINKFNLVASDRISVNRSVPDVRKDACKSEYDEAKMAPGLPSASIIIVFHNEAWSTLLRTVHSVINRSPREVLHEIILVDDASNRTFLQQPLDKYMRELGVQHKVLRSPDRVGLIKARLLGAAAAEGHVLVFLDAHCETTQGWLTPLLSRIAEDRSAVVCPVIDIINDDTFAYVKSFSLHWGGFNWELHFRWFTMGQTVLEHYRETGGTKPYRTPVMAGGLFAISRDYFYEVGSYDSAMDIWGGENLEMSFRIWMCGGSVEISPCSHVGHVFRKASPYSFPRDGGVNTVLHNNLARVAMVWMDDYASFYFKINPIAWKASESQNVDERKLLRRRLRCNSFQWYLDNVWPENFFPSTKRFFGKIKHVSTGECIQRPGGHGPKTTSNTPSGPASLNRCASSFFNIQQLVMENDRGMIMADESVCLDSPTSMSAEAEPSVRFGACNQIARQHWEYDSVQELIRHKATGKCLTHLTSGTSDTLVLQACSSDKKQEQHFRLVQESWRA